MTTIVGSQAFIGFIYLVASGLFIHAYGWIKLAVPLLHARLFDQELWNLDAKLLGGHSPNEFVLTLFSAPAVLRAIDWSYANIFYVSLVIASAKGLGQGTSGTKPVHGGGT